MATYQLNKQGTTIDDLLTFIGTDALTTSAQTLSGAINELDSDLSSTNSHIGTLSNLTTTEKGSTVGAINEVNSKVDAKGLTLLWTNESPTSSYGANSVPLNLTNYDAVLIVGRASTTVGELSTHIVLKNSTNHVIFMRTSSASTTLVRAVSCNDSGVTFQGGVSGTTSSNTSMIPVNIYGIKW